MFSRVFISVQLSVWVVAGLALGAESKVYSGTFQDAAGRIGPLQCELTAKEDGKWTVSFSGKNTGKGPNMPYQYAGELTGKTEGAGVNLSGEVVVPRQGPYVVSAVLTDTTLKATFQKKSGGGDGTFDLVPGKAEPAATQPKAKPEEVKPEPKKEEPKPTP